VPNLELPVYFFHGAYGYTCSYPLAEELPSHAHCTAEGVLPVRGSAHSPILEEPQLAREILATDVLAGTNSRSSLQ
jgi:pimeloyl-ACP methyl ester carboxylesterase